MDRKLATYSALPQKDKAAAYLSLLPEALSAPSPAQTASDLKLLVRAIIQDESVGPVIGRQVLSELNKNLVAGAIKDTELQKQIITDTLEIAEPRLVSYEEQVNGLRFHLADLYEVDEDWEEAARVLMSISMESGQRSVSDEHKLRTNVRIVRLLLEDEDSVKAEQFYNRAALLIHSTQDKELLLSFQLCQARISDYSRRFYEAAMRYHAISWVADIDEEERLHMLSAAVTCAVLAPAGPQRSRVLAALYRDERSADLPTYNILSKMFLDHILRPAEVKSFESTLKPHQLAKIAISSNDQLASRVEDDGPQDTNASTRTGPATVLDRAVMEHNLLASSKIYNNIAFSGLGALLDLTPGAAETMARKMIEQGRLRGSIDQVDKLIWFDDRSDDDDAQGKAGGLGDVDQEAEDTGAPHTKRWDLQIRLTAAGVESIVQYLGDKGLVKTGAVLA